MDEPREYRQSPFAPPPGALDLLLVRHGASMPWAPGRDFALADGHGDPALSPEGVEQAEKVAGRLATEGVDAIYVSSLRRTHETAAPLARLTGLEVILDKDLRERYGGCWEGLTDAQIRERYPVQQVNWDPPDGEPTAAVADRVAGALHRTAAALAEGGYEGEGLAVVVSHGAALRLGMTRLLGMPDDLFSVLGPLSNCSWSVLGQRYGRWRLLEHNAGTLPEPILSDDR